LTVTAAEEGKSPAPDAGSGVDLDRLATWLAAHLTADDRPQLVEVRAPKTGFSATTLLLTLAFTRGGAPQTERVVLRLEQPGHDIFLDTDIGRQGDMMRGLAARGVRAPAVIGIERDPGVLGGKFLVTEHVDGHGLPQHPSYHVAGLLHDLDPAGRHRLWSDAVGGIASINRLDWRDGFRFLDRPAYGPPGLDQYLGWLRAWRAEASGGAPHPVVDPAIDYLEQAKPETDDVAVLWGDSNAGNMLFAADGRLAAMLDFEAAALGPGEIDLGWWFFMDDMLSFGVPRLEGLPDRAEQIAIYEAARGRPTHAIPYYEVLAGVRMALVMVRTTDRLINFGLLPKTSRAAVANPIVQVLASRLDMPSEPTGADYMEMVTVMNRR
jgi:aminoglycoside phosphotransferase (APT) family kinase protein